MQKKTLDTQDEGNPIRLMLQKLCQPNLNLCASFSPDIGVMSALNKTPGLIAVKCELSLEGRPLGIGHGSTAVSRLNKGLDRALYSCLNGALMSAINSACKSLDVIRLEGTQEQLGEAYRAPQGQEAQLASDKQKSYLRELILVNCEDDTDRQERINQLDTLTKQEASEQIQMMAR